jgi:multiple sugar transport system permease protein
MGLLDATTSATLSTVHKPQRALTQWEAKWGYILILPWFIGFLTLVLIPMLASLGLSMTDYSLVSSSVQFLGLQNYIDAFFHEEMFWKSLLITIEYTAITVSLSVVGSLAFALLLNQRVRGIKAFRTLLILPSILPLVGAVILWTTMFEPTYGLINYLLEKINIIGPRWFADSTWALPALILITVWGSVSGTGCIMFLAGLQAIPQELYEAVEADGGNSWHKFRHITLPMLSPTIFMLLVINVIVMFQNFALPYVATRGGPSYSTYVFGIYIYHQAFEFYRMGYASALGWILFAILMIFTYIQFKSQSSWVHYEGGNV